MHYKPKVSFDFDGTIGHKNDIQEYCKTLLSNNQVEVFITTRRYGPDSKGNPEDPWWVNIGTKNWEEVYKLADTLGINRDNIHFCNMKMKYDYLKDKDFLWHLDDDMLEVEEINMLPDTRAIWINEDWLTECNKLINENIKSSIS